MTALDSRDRTGPSAARVLRLFGPSFDEVLGFTKLFSEQPDPPIAWEVFPEVHVKCPDDRIATSLVERFGPAVYGTRDLLFEAAVGAALIARGWTLATAESCTGGLIGHLITNVPGSSHYFRMGVVAYSNEAKIRVLGVPQQVIADHGAVSEPTVREMAERVRALAGSDLGVSVSGIAGPGGGTPEKPVGTVWMALSGPSGTRAVVHRLSGDRHQVKRAAAFHALDLVRRACIGDYPMDQGPPVEE